MKNRLSISALVAVLAALLIGCSRPDEIAGPQPEEKILTTADYNLIALASFDHFDLTPEQKAKLEAAMKKYNEGVRTLMEKYKSGSIAREELDRQLQELERQLDEEIKSILTPEQYEKWKEHQKFIRENKGLPYPLPVPLERLVQLLSLTPDQVEKAKGIVEQAQKDLRAAVESIKDPAELRKAIGEILRRTDAQFRGILTTEQAAKYDEIKRGLQQPRLPYPLPVPLEELARALNLTPDQVQKAQGIVEQAVKDLKTAVETIKDPAELKKAIEDILKRADEQFRNILTPEQAAKYDQLKSGMGGKQYPYPLPLPLDRLAKALELTSDQIEKAKAIVEQTEKDIRATFESIKDPSELRKAIEEILKRTDAQFRGILTDAQAAKYDEIKRGMSQKAYPYPLPFPLEVLVRELQLTSEQVDKAMAIVEQAAGDIRTAVDTIRDREQLKQALEQILMRTDQQFRSILTEQQAAKYDEMKKHRRGSGG